VNAERLRSAVLRLPGHSIAGDAASISDAQKIYAVVSISDITKNFFVCARSKKQTGAPVML